jgi:hypothetical protein
MGW